MKSRASLLAEIEARLVSEAKRLDGIDAALTGTTPGRSSGLLMAASIVAQKRVDLLRGSA